MTATSKQMVMRFGMSEKLGPRVLGRNHDMPFLGRDMGSEPDYSDEVAKEIDDEIRRVIEEAHASATTVLRAHMDELHRLSAILIERETIDRTSSSACSRASPRSPSSRPRSRSRSSRASPRRTGRSEADPTPGLPRRDMAAPEGAAS